jgi:hypothetical protein
MKTAAAAGGQMSEVLRSNNDSQRSQCCGSIDSGKWA